MHRSIEQILKSYVNAHQDDWDVLLPLCSFALNSTHSSSTKQLPAFVVLGREPNLPLEVAVRDVTDSWVQVAIDHVTSIQ